MLSLDNIIEKLTEIRNLKSNGDSIPVVEFMSVFSEIIDTNYVRTIEYDKAKDIVIMKLNY